MEATPAASAREARESLKVGLGSLPAPKNDFEIVVPDTTEEENGNVVEMEDDANTWIEDQADIDQQTEEVCTGFFFSHAISLVFKAT